jgi:uncharacterized protein (DUF1330 family)
MSAFVVVDTKINNPDEYENYKSAARPIAESYGGVYRCRGGEMDIMETDLWSPTRMVIIEFPDIQSARAFANAPEYQPIKAIRRNNAECTLVILDGC